MHLKKKGKTGKNYAETITAMSENVQHIEPWSYRSQLDFQNTNIIKDTLKLQASVTNAATYYFS